MSKYITLTLIAFCFGCPETNEKENKTDTSDTGFNLEDIEGLPDGTVCNDSGICTYECTADECHDGVNLDGGTMLTANCCRESGEDMVCENTSWYIRGSDGYVVADCDGDDICQLIFQI